MSSGRLLASKNDHSNAVVSVCRFTSLSVVSSPDPRRLFTSTGKRVKVRSMGGQKLTSILALSWTLTLVTVVAKSADELECNVRPQDTVSVTNILSEGQDLYGESGNPPRFPCWFNLGLARAGQQFASKNIAQVGLAHFLSLVPLVGNQQLRRALYSTHRSNTPETAFKRYTATALHVQLWYKADILSPEWMKSLLTVRRIHDGTGKYLNQLRKSNKTDFYRPLVTEASNAGRFQPNKRIWNAFKADLAQSRYTELVSNASLKRILRHQPKEVYNQYTFAMTQWAFVALPILFPNRVMITRWTDTELRGFAHLWAVICYVLGMDERFIICRDPSDFEGCQRFLYDMFQVHIVPSLFDMDYEGELMVEAVLRAPEKLVGMAQTEFALIMLLEDILGIPAVHLNRIGSMQTSTSRWGMKSFGRTMFYSPTLQRLINSMGAGYLQSASLTVFRDPGTNPAAVAERLYYLK